MSNTAAYGALLTLIVRPDKMGVATYNLELRIWLAAVCSILLFGYFFFLPGLYRPILQEGLTRILIATVSAIGIAAAIPALRRGHRSQRLWASGLLVLPVVGMTYAVLWIIRKAF